MAKLPAALAALRRFDRASKNYEFLGGQHPDQWKNIEKEYKLAKNNLIKYLPDKPKEK